MNVRFGIDQQLVQRLRLRAVDAAAARAELAERLRSETTAELLRTTPVQTGQLRDGWSQPQADHTESDAAGRSVRTQTNRTAYVGFVEYGTSRQPPARVVGAALRRAAQLASHLFRLP